MLRIPIKIMTLVVCVFPWCCRDRKHLLLARPLPKLKRPRNLLLWRQTR